MLAMPPHPQSCTERERERERQRQRQRDRDRQTDRNREQLMTRGLAIIQEGHTEKRRVKMYVFLSPEAAVAVSALLADTTCNAHKKVLTFTAYKG